MNILEEISEVKKNEVKLLRREFSYSRFSDTEFFNSKCLSLKKEFCENKNISIIAEIKKASPSKGVIAENFDHIRIANMYFENDINCISILTDKIYFQGDVNYLRDIARFKIKPLLRKDFIIDEYQVLEAKSSGADVILLISEMLSSLQIQELTAAAYEVGMEVLLELHSEDQIQKINTDLNYLIGINNRNLMTFETDINTTIKLRSKLPGNPLVVSESGISEKDTIERLKDSGINAILVGEFLMKSKNIRNTIQQLKEWCKI